MNDGARLVGAVPSDIIGHLQAGLDLGRLGIRRVGERWDLRSLSTGRPARTHKRPRTVGETHVATGPAKRRQIRLTGANLRAIDFSGAEIPEWLIEDCVIDDCVFDGAQLDGVSIRSSVIARSSFIGASMREASLGLRGRRRTRWDGANLAAADMRGGSPGSAEFIDCDFSRARLDDVEFRGADLLRCRFAGRLSGTTFYGHRPILGWGGHRESLIDVDFLEATFDYVDFRNLNLDRVRLPSDPKLIYFSKPRCVLEQLRAALQALPPGDPRGLLGVVENNLRWLGPRQQRSYLDPTVGGTAAAIARQVIEEAIQACSATPSPMTS